MSKADYVGVGLNPGKIQKVAPTGPSVFPPVTSEGIEPDISTLEHEATIGNFLPERQKRGGRNYAGEIAGGCRPVSIGTLLTMAFGEPDTTQPDAANAPDVYQHVWNPAAIGRSPVPGTVWTVNVDEDPDDPDKWIVDKFMGCGLNEFGIAIDQNEYVLFTAGIMALRNVEGGAAPVAVRDTSELWSFDEVLTQISMPSRAGGAYQEIPLGNFNFNYSNNLTGADRFRLGSKEAFKWRRGNVNSTLGFTALEEIEEHYRRAIADRPELIKMKTSAKGRQLYSGGATPANALHESMIFEFMAAEYTSGGNTIDASSTVEEIPIEANVVQDNLGQLLTIKLINEHDGEYYLAPTA